MLNAQSRLSLQVAFLGEIHPSLWITAWVSMQSFKKDSLPCWPLTITIHESGCCHLHLRWQLRMILELSGSRVCPPNITCSSGWLRYSTGCQGTCSTEGKASKEGVASECPALTSENRSKGSSFLWHLWMHEGQQLITLNWLVYYRFISKRKKWVVIVFWKTHIIFNDTKIKTLFIIELLSTYESNL